MSNDANSQHTPPKEDRSEGPLASRRGNTSKMLLFPSPSRWTILRHSTVKEKLYYMFIWSNTKDRQVKDNHSLSQQFPVLIHPRWCDFKRGKKRIDTFTKKTSDVYRKVKSLTELTSTLCWSTGVSESIRFNIRSSVTLVSTIRKVQLKLKSDENVVKRETEENTLLLIPSMPI